MPLETYYFEEMQEDQEMGKFMLKGLSRKQADMICHENINTFPQRSNPKKNVLSLNKSESTDSDSSENSTPTKSPVEKLVYEEECGGRFLRPSFIDCSSPLSQHNGIPSPVPHRRKLSLNRKLDSAEEESLKLSLLLAEQQTKHGTNMMLKLTEQDIPEIQELMTVLNCSENNARLIIFEQRMGVTSPRVYTRKAVSLEDIHVIEKN